jgi:hypothetical protein
MSSMNTYHPNRSLAAGTAAKESYWAVTHDAAGPSLGLVRGPGCSVVPRFSGFSTGQLGARGVHNAYKHKTLNAAIHDAQHGLYAAAWRGFGLSRAAVEAGMHSGYGGMRALVLADYCNRRGLDGGICSVDAHSFAVAFDATRAATAGAGGGSFAVTFDATRAATAGAGGGGAGAGGVTGLGGAAADGAAAGAAAGASHGGAFGGSGVGGAAAADSAGTGGVVRSAVGGGGHAPGPLVAAAGAGTAAETAAAGGALGSAVVVGGGGAAGAPAPSLGVGGVAVNGGGEAAVPETVVANAIAVLARACGDLTTLPATSIARASAAASQLGAATVVAALAVPDLRDIVVQFIEVDGFFAFEAADDRAFVAALRDAARARVAYEVQPMLRALSGRADSTASATAAAATAVASLCLRVDQLVDRVDEATVDVSCLEAAHAQLRDAVADLDRRLAAVAGAQLTATAAPCAASAALGAAADAAVAQLSARRADVGAVSGAVAVAGDDAAAAAGMLHGDHVHGAHVAVALAAGTGVVLPLPAPPATPKAAAQSAGASAPAAAPPAVAQRAPSPAPSVEELRQHAAASGVLAAAAARTCERCSDVMTAREGGNRPPCDAACVAAALAAGQARHALSAATGGTLLRSRSLGSAAGPPAAKRPRRN